MEIIDDYRSARRVLMAGVSGGLVGATGLNVVLGNRGTLVEAARQCEIGRKKWRAMVHMQMIEFHDAILAWFLCSFGQPSIAQVAYYRE